MRAATPAVISYLNTIRANHDAISYIADCYTFTPVTGLILTYTNAAVPVTLNGYVYAANSILVDGLKFKCTVGLEVDQQQITISARATDTVGGVPFLQALGRGVFDGAEIMRERAFLNSWSAADAASPVGSVILFKGRVGTEDSIGRTTAQITVNSDLVLLDLQMPRNVYSPACQHVLYDSGCTLVKSAFGTAGVVGPTVPAGSSAFTTIPWPTGPAVSTNFNQGTILFSSGANAGVSANVKNMATLGGIKCLILAYPLYTAPASGDAFTAYFGCDHSQNTCTFKFNNALDAANGAPDPDDRPRSFAGKQEFGEVCGLCPLFRLGPWPSSPWPRRRRRSPIACSLPARLP
ncbi:MAG: DUF2163 domain-containing protein [Methylocella sp.]|nr:MAG: hypothetical protein DLM68_11320 [Hyphomicrobiales bacterium]